MKAGKYAVYEFERRYVLDHLPNGLGAEVVEIEDRYLIGTHLRLRRLSSADGSSARYKLTHKVPAANEGAGVYEITNTYLSVEEAKPMTLLPAAVLVKTRHKWRIGSHPCCIDVIHNLQEPLILCEVEFNNPAEMQSFKLPLPYLQEVTDQPMFGGGHLALNAWREHTLPDLQSERLLLRPLARADAQLVSDYFVRNRRHLEPTSPYSTEEFFTREYWQQRIDQALVEETLDQAYRWILLADDGSMVGTANYTQVSRGPFQACYLGYTIDEKSQGRGLMTEALGTLNAFMFEKKGLHRIMANYMPHNKASGRVLEKLGFALEGLAKNYLQIQGQWEDHVLTSLVR